MSFKPFAHSLSSPAVLLLVLLYSPPAAMPDEVMPDRSRPCFPGAAYRKAVSSVDYWNGIEAVVTLPTPAYDPARLRENSDRSKDNASIYIGGRSGEQEVDCGLSWEVVREPDGSISQVGKAFRPFWRTNKWHSAPARPDLYFYPGDTVSISCRTTSQPDTLLMEVALLSRSSPPTTTTTDQGNVVWAGVERVAAASAQDKVWSPSEVSQRLSTPVSAFTIRFVAPGFATGQLQEFKRVNGLDQSGNEGRPAQPTRSTITGAVWREVYLYRGTPGQEERVPMTPARFTDMRCPDPATIRVEPVGETGEKVDILGISDSVDLETQSDP